MDQTAKIEKNKVVWLTHPNPGSLICCSSKPWLAIQLKIFVKTSLINIYINNDKIHYKTTQA